ncbi:MAG: peroxidase family protein, partial [Gaiellaceae bacterium]
MSNVVGSGFTVTPGDLAFILKQIKIAEAHVANTTAATGPCGALVGPGPDQIPDAITSYGLRTVDGSCNNLLPGREKFAAADVPFPRLAGSPVFRTAEGAPAGFPPQPTSSYAQKKGFVFDSQPRVISNLIVDQTSSNPAAVASARFPVRTQGNPPSAIPCTTDPGPGGVPAGVPADCTPAHKTLFIPNVTTDVGLSPPFNSWFTFFGQFFDHGVDQTVKSGGTVFVPLNDDDPLVLGADGVLGTADDLPADKRFMVLTRAQNQPGPDGILGDDPATPLVDESADDVQNANNTDTPWVDQSQTYTSHSSHQVFLREYTLNSHGKPVATGSLLDGVGAEAGAQASWADVKAQASSLLGLWLKDTDVTNVPMLAADPYGKFIPGAHGFPQYVTATGLVEGDPAANGGKGVAVPANVLHFETPFLTDIAHNADPGTVGPCSSTGNAAGCLEPDADNVASHDFANQPAGTYDDELLNAHFICGDGRCNENIALTAVHQMFHSEHNRLVGYMKGVLLDDATGPNATATGAAALPEWQLPTTENPDGWNGERLFQAARFVTEMEYQHLVFEEFARKMVPAIRPFHVYSPDINPAIPAEFAAATYRFGHSMLTDLIARTNVDPATGAKSENDITLLDGFLNPPEFFNGGDPAQGGAGPLSADRAAGAIIMGSVDQVGNEIDEFVTETARNNLLGLPLDLPVLNIARARDVGIPPLNEERRQIFAKTNDGQLAPYTSWADFGQHLKHPESLINFVAAYGTHPTITAQSTYLGKRAAARAIVDPVAGVDTPPLDASDFMFSTGAYANDANGVTNTGLDSVDAWIGGLAEVTNINGSLLGSTNNYVFQNTLENLQDGDRLYYLARTPGINLRTQLEGNSFAEMIERNTTGTNSLKADVFATADCKFQFANLSSPADGTLLKADGITPVNAITGAGSVNDDPSTQCNENALLLHQPDGTFKYRQINSVDPSGINGQSVYNGTDTADRMFGGLDNDTFWGQNGNDRIEGGGGDDVALGGNGNDILTDLDGADVSKGGPGNDAIDTGPGNDIYMGGDGSDFINAGANDNEGFAGPGNDFIIAGQGADAVFGDGGDDWIEGGTGQDLLQGDHGAPFFDDPGELKPGNDVFVGQPGENDYDAEGGDDIMLQNPAIDRNAGAGGFDWAIHQNDTAPANDDMMINNNLAGVPVQLVVNRDRWQETEADSGSQFDDVIKGTDGVVGLPRVIGAGTGGFAGCDVLDQAGLDRIKGLDALVPPLTGDVNAPQPDVDPAFSISGGTSIVALSAGRRCPLSGAFWGEGDIELGGAGSDSFTGRAGNDIIDGDQELRVRISVRTDPADPLTEIGSTDLMENRYKRDNLGNLIGNTLQQDVFAGLVDPGNLVIVRELVNNAGPTDVDTANFSGPLSQYIITPNPDGSITVCDSVTIAAAGGLLHEALRGDGCDILWRIEQLKFADVTLSVAAATGAPAVTTSPTAAAGVAFGSVVTGAASAARTVTVSNTGVGPLLVSGLSVAGTNPADFSIGTTTCLAGPILAGGSCTVPITFTPGALGARSASLLVADNAAGSPQSIPLTGTGIVAPAPVAAVSPASVAFPNTVTNTPSAALPVTVSNTGNAPLSVSGVTLGGANAGDFGLSSNTCLAGPVAAGGSCTVNVTFTPSALGARSGSLLVADNAAGSPQSVALSGTGVAPPPSATFVLGSQTIQAKAVAPAAGTATAFKTSTASAGTVSNVRVFVDTGSTATGLQVALYTNTSTNHPGTRLATGTLASPVAGQ